MSVADTCAAGSVRPVVLTSLSCIANNANTLAGCFVPVHSGCWLFGSVGNLQPFASKLPLHCTSAICVWGRRFVHAFAALLLVLRAPLPARLAVHVVVARLALHAYCNASRIAVAW
jgi:hypothetical protein